ncbi:MAG: hypothetical protein WDA75_04265 [Candidatus Latescibacterota bacterium]
MLTPLPFDTVTQPWLRAAARAASWFEQHLHDGRLPAGLHDLGSYYKWPLALASLGRTELAVRVFDVVVADFGTEDGDFRTGEAKSADPIYGRIADTYTNTWPLIAARVLDRQDVGRRGLDCLRRRRVQRTGGFLTGRPGQHEDERQDIVTIAGCGNALLAWGHADEATAAGDCLLRVLAAQGGPGEPFHLYIDGEGRPLRGDLGIESRLARIDPRLPGQAYVYWGMATVFLARLHLVTGQERFLAGARDYFARHDACDPAHVYAGIGCCKTGWSAATLFRLTGAEAYAEAVHRAAGEISGLQQEDGGWALPVSPILACDCVGEMAYHLTHYVLELSGR